jgi:uncharacterized membrane protein
VPVIGLTFGELLWSILIIFLFAIWFYLLIIIFADIFKRDISGLAKAGWVIFIIILPLLGILIYLITRPKPTPEELQAMEREARQAAGISTAEELQGLADLHDRGALTDEEFAAEKKKLLG